MVIQPKNLRIAMSDHSGTHIDQLNHVGIKQQNGEYLIYNGIRNRNAIDSFGTKKLAGRFLRELLA